MTEELLEDTQINLPGLLAELVAEATAQEEDEQFFNGTGAPWTGICNNGSVTTHTMDAGLGFGDLTAEDLLDMQDEGLVGAHAGAKYYMHRTIFSVVRKLRADAVSAGDSAGQFIYQQPQGNTPATIWNYPFTLVEGMPDINDNAANKGFVIFGNLKKFAIIGDKGGMKVKILTEGTITDTDGQTSINLAQQDKIAYRFVERVGYVLPKPTAIVVLKTSSTIS
jgi:HK97 family phage major capsid protein